MTGNTGTATTQACAACKFQRRKCSPECPLAPYFPPDQPKQFLNVHKLYGVSNTLRILKQVDPSKRNDAMKSILYEADARDRDPVHGCFGIITLLQSQAEMLREELEYVRAQIHIIEQQQVLASYYSQHQLQQQALQSAYSNQLTTTITSSSSDSYHHHHHCHSPTGYMNQSWQKQLLPSSPTTPTTPPNWIYQHMATASQMQNALDSGASIAIGGGLLSKPSIEVRPSFDTRSLADFEPLPQHSYHDSAPKTEAYESSAESSIKDPQSLDHDELESAAALFTLTSGQSS